MKNSKQSGTIDALMQFAKIAQLVSSEGSYGDVLKGLRVSPLHIIDESLLEYEHISTINKNTVDYFALQYCMVIPVLSGSKLSLQVKDVIQRVNPTPIIDTSGLAIESRKGANRKTVSEMDLSLAKGYLPGSLAVEAITKPVEDTTELTATYKGSKMTGSKYSGIVDIGITNKEGQTKTQPVEVSLSSVYVHPSVVSTVLLGEATSYGLVSRINLWLDGQISFWNDLVGWADVIDKQEKMLKKDKHGIMQKILARGWKAKIFGILKGQPSLAVASNIFTVSKDTMRSTERRLGGPITKSKVRNKIFKSVRALLIIVVDTDRDMINVYWRGIDDYSTFTIKELKSNDSSGLNDLTTVMREMFAGLPARI